MIEVNGDVGNAYILRWQNIDNNDTSIEIVWNNNTDKALNHMADEDLRELFDAIFNDEVKQYLSEPENWVMAEADLAVEEMGF